MAGGKKIGIGVGVAVAVLLVLAVVAYSASNNVAINQPKSIDSPNPQLTVDNSNPQPKSVDSSNPQVQIPSNEPIMPTSSSQCVQSLWQHVYNPARLQVLDNCITASGIIREIRSEADGDYHVLVQLDNQYSKLINEENIKAQSGYLVVEPVCQLAVTQEDAKASCVAFSNHINIPPIGSHVKITGSYVLDKEHGSWAEIHPATSIEIIAETQPIAASTDNGTAQAPMSPPSRLQVAAPAKMVLTVTPAKDPISRGSSQSIIVSVEDENGNPIGDVTLSARVTYASGSTTKSFSGTSDNTGDWSFSWQIGGNSNPGTFKVNISASKGGYESGSGSSSFTVTTAS